MNWDRFCRLCGIVGAALAICTLLSLTGCAALKKDVASVADVCRPELVGDVETALPYAMALVVCEVLGTNCQTALDDLKALGKQDATMCALAEAHAAIVKLANPDPCQGDPTAMPCTCGGQQNPGCVPPLNDNMLTVAPSSGKR